MKFTEGYWLRSERANGLFPAEVYAVTEIPGGVRILAPTKPIESRGDTLNLPVITMEFRACSSKMISVEAWHYEGYDTHQPTFETAELSYEPQIAITEEEILLDTGEMEVRIHL